MPATETLTTAEDTATVARRLADSWRAKGETVVADSLDAYATKLATERDRKAREAAAWDDAAAAHAEGGIPF